MYEGEEGYSFMEVDYAKIGERIKTHRRKQKLTQEKLAEKVDVGTRHINCIENGAKKMSLTLLIKIAYMLNTTLDDLISGSIILKDF